MKSVYVCISGNEACDMYRNQTPIVFQRFPFYWPDVYMFDNKKIKIKKKQHWMAQLWEYSSFI